MIVLIWIVDCSLSFSRRAAEAVKGVRVGM